MNQSGPNNVQTTSGTSLTSPRSAFEKDLSPAQFNRGLGILVLLGLVTRTGFLLEHARSPSFGVPTLDQTYYDTVARMLLTGADLHSLHGFRPLLYPAFLAFWYKLGGSWGVDLALVVQHLLGVATGILVAWLGYRAFKHRLSGLAAGILFLLAPVPLYFEGELLIEPSYIFLICVNLWLVVEAAESGGWRGRVLWTAAGMLTVLTSQARANILVFLAVYPIFALWCWWRARDPKTLLPPLLGLVGALAMAVPWGLVNMKQMDHFHLLPNAGGVAFYLGNKRTADGMVPDQERRITTGERYEDSIEVWAREEYESAMQAEGRQPSADPMDISRYWTARGIREIAAAPTNWIHLLLKKCWLTLWNVEVPNNKSFAFLQQEFLWLQWLPVRWVVLLMLAPAGIWAAAKWGCRNAALVLLVYAGLYCAANVGFFICDRYRYPVWPAMAALGGGGLVASIQLARQRRSQQLAFIGLSMMLMASLSLPNWFGARLPTFARDYLFRSLACYEKGLFREALDDIDRSIKLDPLDANALHQRANVLYALGRFQEAKRAYEVTLERIPNEGSVWNNLGATLDQLGQRDAAVRAYNRAINCNPPSRNSLLALAFFDIRDGRLDQATEALDHIERLDQAPAADVLATRSVLLRRKGEADEARALETEARRLDTEAATWAFQAASKL